MTQNNNWEEEFDEKFPEYTFINLLDDNITILHRWLKSFIKNLLSTQKAQLVEKIEGWTDFTCHSRAEHSRNDCPGWSHEDGEIRKILLSQIIKLIKG